MSKYICTIFVGAFLAANFAASQSLAPAPLITSKDEAGVDVISGDPSFKLQDLSIGNGVSSLSHTISNGGSPYFWGFADDFDVYVAGAGTFGADRLVVLGHTSQLFDKITAGYVAHNGDGATLTLQKTNINVNGKDTNTYTYVSKDGTKFVYQYQVNTGTEVTALGVSSSVITYPNGYEVTVVRDSEGRKQSILTNTGLQFKYINGHVNDAPAGASKAPSVSSIIAINQAYEYCNPTASSCSLTNTWPTVTYDWPAYSAIFFPKNTSYAVAHAVEGKFKVTDAEGRVTQYNYSPHDFNLGSDIYYTPRIVAVKDSTAPTTAANVGYNYDDYIHCYFNSMGDYQCDVLKIGVVANAFKGTAQWTYNYDQPYTQFVITGSSTGPRGTHSTVMTLDGDVSLAATGVNSYLSHVSTPNGESVYYGINKANLPMSAGVRGKSFTYEYGARNNMVKHTQGGKISSAEYQPCTATNFKWCNKPTAIIDAKLNRTDYAYYDEHGQIKSITQPATSTTNSVRPQTRYKYTQLYAWYKNAANVMTRETRPVWMLTEESSCSQGGASGDGCVIPSALVTTRYYYGPDAGPNNLWLRGVEKIADGKTLRTCYQYNIYGHVIAETAPKAGLSSCL